MSFSSDAPVDVRRLAFRVRPQILTPTSWLKFGQPTVRSRGPGRVTSVVAAKSGARRSSGTTLEATAALASMASGDVPRVRRARVGEFTRVESPQRPDGRDRV